MEHYRHQGQQGQALAIFAVMATVALLFTGLAVDTGNIMMQRRIAQSAADAAARAGAYHLANGATYSTINTAIQTYATANTGPMTSTTVAVSQFTDSSGTNIGATSAAIPGGTEGIRVTAQRVVPTLFLGLVGMGTFTVQGTARANLVSTTTSGGAASLLVLDPSACAALTLSGNANIDAQAGGVQVNSNCTSGNKAVNLSGNADITGTANIVGTYNDTSTGGFSPAPTTGATVVPDPLASLATPTFTSPSYAAASCSSNATVNINPGYFTGGLTGSGNCVMNMAAGDYVIRGNINFSGNARLVGTNVFIYMACSNYPASGGTCYTLSLSGNGIFNLTPPSSGTYQNMSIFIERGNTNTHTISGNGAVSGIAGSIYGAGATVNISGNGTMPGQLVVKKLTASGNGTITVQGSASVWSGTTTTSTVALVE